MRVEWTDAANERIEVTRKFGAVCSITVEDNDRNVDEIVFLKKDAPRLIDAIRKVAELDEVPEPNNKIDELRERINLVAREAHEDVMATERVLDGHLDQHKDEVSTIHERLDRLDEGTKHHAKVLENHWHRISELESDKGPTCDTVDEVSSDDDTALAIRLFDLSKSLTEVRDMMKSLMPQEPTPTTGTFPDPPGMPPFINTDRNVRRMGWL